MGGFHGFGTCRPVGRADFAMLFEVLEGIDHANGFVHVPPEGKLLTSCVGPCRFCR